MQIRVNVNTSGADRLLLNLRRDQVPFATSVALNETGKRVQQEQRNLIQRNFKIRRPWVLQAVKITSWAKKNALQVVLSIAGDHVLAKFEEGGTKTPRGKSLAIPDEARRTKADIVPKSARPKAFDFELHGRGSKATVFKGAKRTFMIRTHDNEGGVFQRVGRGKGSTVRMLFSFARAAKIDKLLHFHETARREVPRMFPGEFRKAFAKALASAKRK